MRLVIQFYYADVNTLKSMTPDQNFSYPKNGDVFTLKSRLKTKDPMEVHVVKIGSVGVRFRLDLRLNSKHPIKVLSVKTEWL
jgi:hypothetical protein